MSDDYRDLRRALLDRIVALQMELQVTADAETRAELAQAREALRLHDEGNLLAFERLLKRD